ncbi:MAG: ferritin-like domain-containing protein [Polyangiaceae bacterium]
MIDLELTDVALSRFVRDLDAQAPRTIPEGLRPDLTRATPTDVDHAQLAWSNRVIGEYRGVVIYTELLALFAELAAPYAALAAIQRIIGDELRHTKLCAEVVSWLDGWSSLEVELEGQRMPPHEGSPAARALEIVARELVLVETHSVATLRAYLRAAEDPAIRAVLESLLADEVRHVAAGRALEAWIAERYDDPPVRAARARLDARLPEECAHLRAASLARATDGPGRALGASLRPADLDGDGVP